MDYLISRILSAFLSGMLMSQAGSFIQLGTRNILASPSTLGFDGLAVLWLLVFHTIVLALGVDSSALAAVAWGAPLFMLIGGLFSLLLKGQRRFEKIILLGLTFNLMVGAVFSLWQFFFLAFNLPFPVELWFGHFRFAAQESVYLLLLTELLLLLGLLGTWREMMIFSLGNALSENWVLKTRRLYSFLFISVSLGTFIVVALFGAFSFLGLVFPIVSRKLWFKRLDLKGEILVGSVFNGLCLMLIDVVCYYFPIWGAELPVGLLVTAVGAACLIILLWKSDSRELLAKPKK